MKEGYLISKSAAPAVEEMAAINRLSRRNLRESEVFVFSVALCDNEIDRDFERFSADALYKLSELFIGKTGVFDHSAKSRDQTARIFACRVEKSEGKNTKAGEIYHRLLARAYMPRTDRNKDLITEIDAGIKKEVSVGCSVGKITCSVCGAELKKEGCAHVRGQIYDHMGSKRVCHAVLSEPADAYEWSFVAVPAQPQAGGVKAFHHKKEVNNFNAEEVLKRLETAGGGRLSPEEARLLTEHLGRLEKQAEAGREYFETLKNEVVELGCDNHGIPPEILKGVAERMSVDELKSFKAAFSVCSSGTYPAAPQLLYEEEARQVNEMAEFKI